MNRLQKAGIRFLGYLFVVMGIILLVKGVFSENTILRAVGAAWLPLGVINAIVINRFIRNN